MGNGKPIFYDEERRRWRRTRRVMEVSGVLLTLLLAYFFVNIAASVELPAGLLPDTRPIYRAIRAKADQGLACVINSSDAMELAGLCDRVLVIVEGRISAELKGAELTEGNITRGFMPIAAVPAEAASTNGAAAH